MGKVRGVLFLGLLIFACYMVVSYYSFLFSKTVKGTIVEVQRVTQVNQIVGLGAPIPDSQIFSFAIAIKVADGEILTASSEDRQWAVAQKDQCVEAKYFPYPPWDLNKAGTYFGARLLRLTDCTQ